MRGRALPALGLALFAGPALLMAQDTPAPGEPRLEVVFEETEAIPGQPLTLRLTVLVPTFLPDPPVWPSFETPNLLVTLPERATGPVSERIGGETWSGVSRRYLISPMVPGSFALPAHDVIVTWSDADSGEKRQTVLRTEPLTFEGIVPEGAQGLDPFIAAADLSLEQDVSGEPESLVPGDAVKRTVHASVRGVSPIFLPSLMPPHAIGGVRAYPGEPVLEVREERGITAGSRTEEISLVAEGGGSGRAPDIEIAWFNLETGEIETASAEGFDVAVDGPPAASAVAAADWPSLLRAALMPALILLVVLGAVASSLPRMKRWVAARQAAWLVSEDHAWRQLGEALDARDYPALYPALDRWAARLEGPDPRGDRLLRQTLADLGALRFAAGPVAGEESWRDLRTRLEALRARARVEQATAPPLPALNPPA